MAVGSLYVTAPALAAAVGFYFLDRSHSKSSKRFGESMEDLVLKMKEKVKSGETPMVAPQFDGLHCFETLVAHE